MNINPREPRYRTINGIHALTRLSPDLFYPVVDSVPPAFKLVADGGDLNYLADIAQANPRVASETILIARPFALVSRAAEMLSAARDTDEINAAAGWLHNSVMQVRSALPRVAMLPIYWEGPNETPGEMIEKLATFDAESIRLARRDGIRRLVGGFAEGNPKILDWPVYPGDTRDDWPAYYPALQKIHEAGANVAMLHVHEYIWTNAIQNKTIDRNEFVLQRYRCGRINDVYNRHIRPNGWNIAAVISEGPLEDPRNCGLSDEMKLKWLTSPEWEALYCNEVKALTQYDWSATQDEQWQHYSLRAISKGMLAHISSYRPAGIIEVPPAVEENTMSWVVVSSEWGCNLRKEASITSEKLGYIAPGSRLRVEYPARDGYVKAYGQNFWILAANLTNES